MMLIEFAPLIFGTAWLAGDIAIFLSGRSLISKKTARRRSPHFARFVAHN
jgi:hypothetical protein